MNRVNYSDIVEVVRYFQSSHNFISDNSLLAIDVKQKQSTVKYSLMFLQIL
jgi:hypothetical protein